MGHEQLECAIGVYGADNVLFGGSFPVRHEWMIKGVDPVRNLDIGDEDKALVLGGNARKLFNLSSHGWVNPAVSVHPGVTCRR